jgi:hypothetical protein
VSLRRRLERLEGTARASSRIISQEALKALSDEELAALEDALEAALEQDKERDEEQRRAENLDELRKDLLQRLHQAYSDCKRTKRLLRVEASKPSYYGTFNQEAKVNLEKYDEHLQALNDIQLDLEIMAKDADANHMAFAHSKEIAAAIRGMEETLKPPIREYESKRGNLDWRNPPKVSDLQELRDIMDHRGEGRILTNFTDYYREAVKYIQQDIITTD